MRNITINTDASFHPKYKTGGFAFYIVCDQFKILKSGILKDPVNSHFAELQSIANALHTLVCCDFKVDFITINTDYITAISELEKPSHFVSKHAKESLKKLMKRTGAKSYKVCHVKAHSGTGTPRQWVNDWCDREAKKHMRIAKKILTTNNPQNQIK